MKKELINMKFTDDEFNSSLKNMDRDSKLNIFEQWILLGKALSKNNGINNLSPYSTIEFVPMYKKGHYVFISENKDDYEDPFEMQRELEEFVKKNSNE